jgi:hypothetical protein
MFAITGGLTLRPAFAPLTVLLILINTGYALSASFVLDQARVVTWVVTSWYLAFTALFFAAVVGTNTEARLAALMRGCMVAGVIAVAVAILSYFRILPGSAEWLLYDRARGTFKDPNVFGAYLVLPALLALQQVIAGRFRQAMSGALLFGLFAAGILLSFSRASWGMMALTALAVLGLSFITTTRPRQRMRIVMLAVAGGALIALMITALLSLDAVDDLFKQRMSFDQSYDVGETGRFGRHILGALLALDTPQGIGPLQFNRYFPEDPHNSYLNAFMSGGWLAGASYLTLALLTLAYGLRPLFLRTPWQPTYIVVYTTYAGVALESVIIDSDHWRHAFLLLGLVWGLIVASRAYVQRAGVAAGLVPDGRRA